MEGERLAQEAHALSATSVPSGRDSLFLEALALWKDLGDKRGVAVAGGSGTAARVSDRLTYESM